MAHLTQCSGVWVQFSANAHNQAGGSAHHAIVLKTWKDLGGLSSELGCQAFCRGCCAARVCPYCSFLSLKALVNHIKAPLQPLEVGWGGPLRDDCGNDARHDTKDICHRRSRGTTLWHVQEGLQEGVQRRASCP